MGAIVKKLESMSNHAFGVNVTQFEITSDLLRNLYKFNLTPVTKLVLLELTTHLNESKNGSVVFPSVNYIAEVLGIGLTATKKAINDLIKEGLIIKSKRDNVRGNYNKYLIRLAKMDFNGGKKDNDGKYTQPNIKGQKTANERAENELFKQPQNDLFLLRTNNKEQIEQQTELKKPVKIGTNSKKEGGNVYSGDDEILADYAVKHNAKNVNAYIAKLKETKSAEKIIKEYKKKKNCLLGIAYDYTASQKWLQQQAYESALPQYTAESCGYSLSDLKKRGIIK